MRNAMWSIVFCAACGGAGAGGTLQATFSDVSGTNADLTPFSAAQVAGDVGDRDGVFSFSGDDHPSPDPAHVSPGRLLIIDVKDSAGGTRPVAGRQYVLRAPGADASDHSWFAPGVAELTITERLASGFHSWTARDGEVTITAVDGDRVSLRFRGTMMQPAMYTESTGTFTLSGDCTVAHAGVGVGHISAP